ncbi:hypothetical protein VTK73DRAFT_6460 [Phialemonium thermophilum]|uniref:Uncharacterized protein n=1 Tax=Phialemonium thermophilum TaxID=223376 RepID=A0ABR3WJC8_9PEZI
MNYLQPRADHRFNPSEPHPELDDVNGPDFSNTDWSNDSDPFGIFAARGMAAPPVLSPSQVRREAGERSSRILANYRLLNDIMSRHEAKIQKRWEKKTRSQRLKILLDCWPNLPKTHRPDFAIFRRYGGKMGRVSDQERGAFIWPYINQEDLARTKSLPLLLNARGRNQPTEFAAADCDAMHLGKVTMAVVPIFLNEHVMVLNGTKRDDEYGKLLAWEEHEDAFDWMQNRRQFIPGEGLLILEAQDQLLDFLIKCCRLILHDIPAEQMVSDIHPVEPEPPRKISIDSSGAASLAAMAEEAPYRPPADIDFTRIESLLSARVAGAEDHIWSLREDPSYFSERLFEMRDHRLEMLKDREGGVQPTLEPPREGLLWARVVGNVLVEAYFQLEIFSKLRSQAATLRDLKEKYAADISSDNVLPEEYLSALLKFRHYLNQAAKGPMNQLKTAVPASPPFRGYFLREIPGSSSSFQIKVASKPGVKMNKTVQQVLWLLQTLWEDGQNLFLCRLPFVVDELDRLLNTDQEARELVSPYVAMLIGELSIIGECLRQIDTYFPWANSFEFALIDRDDNITKDFAEATRAEAKLLTAFRDRALTPIASLANPSDKKFDYPMGKKRNKENVEKLRKAEEYLDTFWARADGLMYSSMGNLDGMVLKELLTQRRLLYRTPPWTEPSGPNKQKPESNLDAEVDALTKPLSALYFDLEAPSARKLALATGAKSKIKTRGTPAPQAGNQTVAQTTPEENPSDPQPRFNVDSRALKVFRILFYNPNVNTTPGEVAWHDFLHAMASTGFSAQKLYGSVWHFQPSNIDVERSIQFHEPHPSGKIPFLVARRYGRRLNRAYGWFGGMFITERKT